MAAIKPQTQVKNFFIMGPAMQDNNGVIEAVYSLYYLPVNFKLLLPAVCSADEQFRNKIVSIIKENALDERVYFINSQNSSNGSPEAFASAVFDMARAAD